MPYLIAEQRVVPEILCGMRLPAVIIYSVINNGGCLQTSFHDSNELLSVSKALRDPCGLLCMI